MLSCPLVEKRVIRGHYNLSTPFYRLLWGPHIHHGYWEADESPRAAQLQLTERLATLATVASGAAAARRRLRHGRLVDPSGQDARLRGRRRHDQPAAATLGRRFVALACASAVAPSFAVPTRSRSNWTPSSFDVVWSVECTEHLFDKPRFFARAADVAAARRHDGDLCLARRRRTGRRASRSRCTTSARVSFARRSGTAERLRSWMTAAGLERDARARLDRCG